MRLLLDTHAFLWWIEGAPELPKRAAQAIANPKNECVLSLASCWEIAIKLSLGKLRLAAQALEERLTIVSADGVFQRYGVKRVW
ncbi:MAG: type II toxin-antitoxin system VapC family toxin [Betaproteobacteria bacterium]|nr:type II toxin-antitoxin system VapC family toxin [Betaproteobacteria bacterium]